ncbi:MAG: Ig-like domain-containing domain [Chitinophagales bacterium]
MKKANAFYLLFLFPLIIFYSCANQVTPSGGDKDTTPPVAIAFVPDTNSTFFSAKKIEITFDEFIQLNDAFNQISISPPLDENPNYTLKGKKVTITIPGALKEETTYTINFGQAIKDTHEGNILNNFTYVFSTGAVLDSIQVSGTVRVVQSGKPSADTYVLLYLDPTDSSFTTSRPYYFAKTDKNGNFLIRNIKEGKYGLYAVEDKNFNYYYDLPNESIAFSDTLLQVVNNVSGASLRLFSENKAAQNLTETKSPGYGTSKLVFSKPATDVGIIYTGPDSTGQTFIYNAIGDTVYYFNPDKTVTSHTFTIRYDTTVLQKEIELKSFPEDTVLQKKYFPFISNIPAPGKSNNAAPYSIFDLNREIILRNEHPIVAIKAAAFHLTVDSLDTIPCIPYIDSTDARILHIPYPAKPANIYTLHIDRGAATDLFGLRSDSLHAYFKTRNAEDYGTLILQIKNTYGSGILFELHADALVFDHSEYIDAASFKNADSTYTLRIPYLLPGKYTMRATVDTDGNKKWTSGDLKTKTQPEMILYFPQEQTLRANWENEITWELR